MDPNNVEPSASPDSAADSNKSHLPLYLWGGAAIVVVVVALLLWGLGIVGANADYICTKTVTTQGPCANGSWGAWTTVSESVEDGIPVQVQQRVYTGIRSTSRQITYLSGRTTCAPGYTQTLKDMNWFENWSGFHGGDITITGAVCQVEQVRRVTPSAFEITNTLIELEEVQTIVVPVNSFEELEGGEYVAFDDVAGRIQARPALVRRGGSSLVTWDATGVPSCTVTSNTGRDSWSGLTGSETSAPIEEETTFTLVCPLEEGDELRAEAKVGIAPVFQEQ